MEQLEPLLGPRLTHLWRPEGGGRPIGCVSMLVEPEEGIASREGELAVLLADTLSHETICLFLEHLAARQVAGLLVPAGRAGLEMRRWAALATERGLVLGQLAAGCEARMAANLINRVLAGSRHEGPHQKLFLADSLQALAETLGHQVGNSITIETPQHDLLAFSATNFPVDRVREETILRRHGSAVNVLSWLARDGYLAAVVKSDQPVRVPAKPEMEFSGRVVARAAADDEVLALIWVTESVRPLGSADFTAIQQAAEAAAAILLRQREVARKQAAMRAEFLEDVIHGRIMAPETMRALARNLDWDIDRVRQALVVAIDHFETFRLRQAEEGGRHLARARERLAEIARLAVMAVDPSAVVGQRSAGLVVLCNTTADAPARKLAALRLADRIVQRVAESIPDMTVTVGIGRDFPSFEHVAESFRQAELAGRLGASLWGGNRAIHYDDLGVHRLLFAMREQEEMITPALARLLAHDTQHKTEYVRTLTAYFGSMGRLRTAAAELGIHRNTLEYRMGRIQELAGTDLDHPDNRLALELGIQLLKLRQGMKAGQFSADG
ncbi:MAG TPA: helix-turn-helix domain-containing protein [Chloroflexota bacterium]|nr:helix-turn-helix domain-containing protein [Chloroflexota bacterium]